MKRGRFLKICLIYGLVPVLAMFAVSASSAEKEYPTRDIEVVVPFPPGGMADLVGRVVSDELSKNFGSPVVVVNKAGGDAIPGLDYVARTKPDGYTILIANNAQFALLRATQSDLPFKWSDFIPIARLVSSPNLIVVRKEAPWKTLEELVTFAKKNPGKLTCGVVGTVGITTFNLELLKIEAGLDIRGIPFQGGAPTNTAVLGGHIDFANVAFAAVQGLLKSGDLRALASTMGKVPEFPEIPTLAEKGYPRATLGMWTGIFMLKGVEKTILEKISRTVEKIMKTPQVVKKLEDIGYQTDYVAGKEFALEIEKEFTTIADVIKKAKLTFK